MLCVSAIFLCIFIASVELAPNEFQSGNQNCSAFYKKTFFVQTFETMTWYEAAEYCFKRGWQLANPATQQEDEEVLKALKDAGMREPPLYWIGGTNQGDLVSYYWFGIGKQFAYTNWAPGKPDNEGNNQHCALFVRGDNLNQWDDEQCIKRVYFICESRPC